jgi:hypothetical protein
VILSEDGSARAAPAHLLLTLDTARAAAPGVSGDGAEPATTAAAAALPEALVAAAADPIPVETFVLEHEGVPLLERLRRELQERLPEREYQLVQAYNLRTAEGMRQRRLLKDDVARGVPAAKSKLDRLEAETGSCGR